MQHNVTRSPTAIANVSPWLPINSSNHISLGKTVSCTSERSLVGHEHLFFEGEVQTHVYLVLAGVFSTYCVLEDGRRQISSFAFPGDIVGLDCTDRHVNSAESLTASKVRSIPLQAISSLILNEPGFGLALQRILARELAATRDQILSLGRKSAAEKLATFLLNINQRNRFSEQMDDVVSIPMKRCDIADFLGLTVETVSRNFTKLKNMGIVSILGRSTVKIEKMDLLELMAQGCESVQIH